MKKKSLILGTCLCLMLSLAACSKSKTSEGDKTGEVASGSAITSGSAIEGEDSASTKSNVKVTLGQYKGIEVTVASSEVTDEEIKQQLDSYNQYYGVPIKVTDRTDVKDGDTVNIDFEGKVDGVAFQGGTATGSALTIGSGQFIPGFEEGLVGKEVGNTVEVPVTFPEKYDNNPELAGKKAVFTVKINFIQSGEYEPLTDDIVAKNDTKGNKTVADLEAYIRNSLKTSRETAAQEQKSVDVVTKAIENATFANLEQKEIDDQVTNINNYYTSVATQYGSDLEAYVKSMGLTLDAFNKEVVKMAEFSVKQNYLLEAIVAEEKLEATDEEKKDMLTKTMTDYGYTDEQQVYTAAGSKENFEKTVLLQKAKDLIVDSAVVKEK